MLKSFEIYELSLPCCIYTWTDIGSSYLSSELIAAFLWAQMEAADAITGRRLTLWEGYHKAFEHLERLRQPIIPGGCGHNAHFYYLLLRDPDDRTRFIAAMQAAGICCVFHYVPLHRSPQGRQGGRAHGELPVTDELADRLVHLPLWLGFEDHQERIIEAANTILAG